MGLILCENPVAEHPLYIQDMGLRVFTLEELCFVIYNYPLIAMDGLVNERLMDFLKNDLRIGLQVVNLERSLGEWANYDDVLVSILNLSDYYSQSETDEYRLKIADIRKLPRYEFYRQKGDLLFGLKQYGKAISYYEKSLFDSKDQKADDIYFYRVYKSMGSTYANLFLLDESFAAYRKAYDHLDDEELLRKIYYLSKLQDNIEKKQECLDMIKDRSVSDWDRTFEDTMRESSDDESLTEIERLDSLDSVKKHRSIENIINRWKRKYRNML